MKNQPIIRSASNNASCLRGLFRHLLGRSDAGNQKVRMIKVWDMQRDSYRDVDLNDRNDPLWPTARELYLFSKTPVRRNAA